MSRLPAGALVVSMQTVAGETTRDRVRRERGELHQLKLKEWWVEAAAAADSHGAPRGNLPEISGRGGGRPCLLIDTSGNLKGD